MTDPTRGGLAPTNEAPATDTQRPHRGKKPFTTPLAFFERVLAGTVRALDVVAVAAADAAAVLQHRRERLSERIDPPPRLEDLTDEAAEQLREDVTTGLERSLIWGDTAPPLVALEGGQDAAAQPDADVAEVLEQRAEELERARAAGAELDLAVAAELVLESARVNARHGRAPGLFIRDLTAVGLPALKALEGALEANRSPGEET